MRHYTIAAQAARKLNTIMFAGGQGGNSRPTVVIAAAAAAAAATGGTGVLQFIRQVKNWLDQSLDGGVTGLDFTVGTLKEKENAASAKL